MTEPHQTLASERVFEGRLLSVWVETVALPAGGSGSREVVKHPGAAGVVALDGTKVLLVSQWRHAVGSELLELPAGLLDPEETPLQCARRELEEETGYRCGELFPLGVLHTSPGFTNEVYHLFLTKDLFEGQKQAHDHGETLTPVWMDLNEAIDAVLGGRITNAVTALGLTLARLHGKAGFGGNS